MVNDTIGDFIIRLKNAGAVKKESVSVPFSALKMAVAEKLRDAGFVTSIDKKGKKVRKTIELLFYLTRWFGVRDSEFGEFL